MFENHFVRVFCLAFILSSIGLLPAVGRCTCAATHYYKIELKAQKMLAAGAPQCSSDFIKPSKKSNH